MFKSMLFVIMFMVALSFAKPARATALVSESATYVLNSVTYNCETASSTFTSCAGPEASITHSTGGGTVNITVNYVFNNATGSTVDTDIALYGVGNTAASTLTSASTTCGTLVVSGFGGGTRADIKIRGMANATSCTATATYKVTVISFMQTPIQFKFAAGYLTCAGCRAPALNDNNFIDEWLVYQVR